MDEHKIIKIIVTVQTNLKNVKILTNTKGV